MPYRAPEFPMPTGSRPFRPAPHSPPIIDSPSGADMDANNDELAVSISAFKKQTETILKEANHRPIAVLRHGAPAFFVMDPLLYAAIMEDLADQPVYQKTIERLANASHLVEVDIDDL